MTDILLITNTDSTRQLFASGTTHPHFLMIHTGTFLVPSSNSTFVHSKGHISHLKYRIHLTAFCESDNTFTFSHVQQSDSTAFPRDSITQSHSHGTPQHASQILILTGSHRTTSFPLNSIKQSHSHGTRSHSLIPTGFNYTVSSPRHSISSSQACVRRFIQSFTPTA